MESALRSLTPHLRINQVTVDVPDGKFYSDTYTADFLGKLLEREDHNHATTSRASSVEKAPLTGMLKVYLEKMEPQDFREIADNSDDSQPLQWMEEVNAQSAPQALPTKDAPKGPPRKSKKIVPKFPHHGHGHREGSIIEIPFYNPATGSLTPLNGGINTTARTSYSSSTGSTWSSVLEPRLNPRACPYTPKVPGYAVGKKVQHVWANGLTSDIRPSKTAAEEPGAHCKQKTKEPVQELTAMGYPSSEILENEQEEKGSSTSDSNSSQSTAQQAYRAQAAGSQKPPVLDLVSVARMISEAAGSLELHARKITEAGASILSEGDEVASQNTLAEYWSVSSYHTTSHGPPQDEDLPPAEFTPDFELPLESLLRPIKKTTYQPITQEEVQNFLAEATWKGPESSPTPEARWTSKQIPLEPVLERRHYPDNDRFLEGLQQEQEQQEQLSAERRSRLERYPGNEAVFEHYSEELVNEEYTSHLYVNVKRISTQSTNPPVWYAPHRPRASDQAGGHQNPPMSPKPPTTKECLVCVREAPFEELPQSIHMSEHNICQVCVETYLGTKILKEGVLDIRCPAENCSVYIEYDEIKANVNETTFNRKGLTYVGTNYRYDELLSRKACEEDPYFRWCTNPTCSVGQIVEDGDRSTHFVCQSCNFKSCYQCRTPTHPGLTCSQNLNALRSQQFAGADESSGSWLKSYTKPCYCGRWIQKMEGCDHVKCPPRPAGCGEEWCWMCGARYDEIRRIGNTAHKADCPHFA